MVEGLPPGAVAFAAICVDDDPRRCARDAQNRWPNVAHFWVEAAALAACRVAFVPNRCVIAARDRRVVKWWRRRAGTRLRGAFEMHCTVFKAGRGDAAGRDVDILRAFSRTSCRSYGEVKPTPLSGRFPRRWDGSHGNVLRGPHGASRTNGSQSLARAIAGALR